MTDLARLLGVLAEARTDFVIVGGFAGTLHGSSVPTRVLDIDYSREPVNIRKLEAALSPFAPYLRGAPPGLPFTWDGATIRAGFNLTLTTSIGALDLLGEIAGGGDYDRLLPDAVSTKAFGVECKFQGTQGSAEEKIPAIIQDIAAWPIPGLVVFSGPGFSANIKSFLIASGRAVDFDDLDAWLRLFFSLDLPAEE